jgi:DnaJ-class molecular chaperone
MGKKGFLDGYKKYNPEVEGYGNPDSWKKAFNERMGYQEAVEFLKDTDPYSVLEISKDATFAEIKKQFHKLAMIYHPDKNRDMDTTEKMKKILAAYTILKNKLNKK